MSRNKNGIEAKSSKAIAILNRDDKVKPIEVMIHTMREIWYKAEETNNLEMKKEACAIAKDAAPYFHPKLANNTTTIRHISSVEDLADDELVAILSAAGTGTKTEVAPVLN